MIIYLTSLEVLFHENTLKTLKSLEILYVKEGQHTEGKPPMDQAMIEYSVQTILKHLMYWEPLLPLT